MRVQGKIAAAATAVVALGVALLVVSLGVPDGCGGDTDSVSDSDFATSGYGMDGGPPNKCTDSKCHICGQGCDAATGQCTGEPCGGSNCYTCTPNGCVGCNEKNCQVCEGEPGKDFCANEPCEQGCKNGSGKCACTGPGDCNNGGNSCQTCKDGECVSACNEANCEHCENKGDGSMTYACISKCFRNQTCDGKGGCSDCNPACDHTQCLTCEDGKCVNGCTEGTTCDGNGTCVQQCPGAKPNACSVCQNGAWVDPCTKGNCQACDAATGQCKSTCAVGYECIGNTCRRDSNDCDPECQSNQCMTCVQTAPGRSECQSMCRDGQICEGHSDYEWWGKCTYPCPEGCDGDDGEGCVSCDQSTGACIPCPGACLTSSYDGQEYCSGF